MSLEKLLLPGHPDAIAKGCTCPINVNNRGKGTGEGSHEGNDNYWCESSCPIHGDIKPTGDQ